MMKFEESETNEVHNIIIIFISLSSFLILDYYSFLRVSNGLAHVSSQPKFSGRPSKTPLPISFAFRILTILFAHYVIVRLGVLKCDHESV